MTESEPKTSLHDLIAAERASAAEAGADDRIWAAIERRLIDGPPPPDLGAAASPILKWAAGLALVGGVLGGAALGLAGERGPAGDEGPPGAVAAPASVEPAPAPEASATIATTRGGSPTGAEELDVPAPAGAVDSGSSGHVPEDLSSETFDSIAAEAAPKAPARPRRPAKTGDPKAEPKTGDPKAEPKSDPPETDPPAQGLDAELRLIARIRGALRRGDPEGALALIADHRRLFADGALVQERCAHEVEALCGVGRRSAAEAKAAEFLDRWPDSPHRAAVQAGCGE